MVKLFILFIASTIAVPMATHAQFFEEGHLVTDVRNNIIWLRCSVGQRWDYDTGKCVGKVARLNQEEIEDAIGQADQQLGGSWRLPSVEELSAPTIPNDEIIPLDSLERQAIIHALNITAGNVRKAAKCLGISRTTLYNKASRYSIDLREDKNET